MRRGIAVVVLLVVVGVGWRVLGASRRAPVPTQQGPAAVAVEVSPAVTKTLLVTVTAAGTVQPLQDVTVSAKLSARVTAVLVKEGDTVRAGQVLVRLEGGDLAAQVRQAEANLRAAQARLQMLEEGARPQERAQAETSVLQAQANLATAKDNLARMQALYQAGAIGKAQLDSAQAQFDIARAQYEAALQQRSMVMTGSRPEEIEMARAQVAQADAALALARWQAANATITAPLAGTVTRRWVDPGVVVSLGAGQGMALVQVSQIDSVYVVLDVSETDLARIRLGQPVTVRLDAYPNRAFAGMVNEIGQASEGQTRVFKVKVLVDNPGHALKPGMFGRGDITVARRENALVIPRDAVVSIDAEATVFVEDGNTARLRKLQLGVISGPVVEVLAGLREGEMVIVAGQSGLADGTAITVH